MKQMSFGTAVGRLFFFAYGKNLLRPSASSWILTFGFLAAAMAVLEGMTWGRILSVFLPENLPWVAVLVGVIWGTAIFAVDGSYATLDTSADYRKGVNPGIGAPAPQPGWRASFKNKVLMGTLARLSIVCISMAITGPFLAHTLEERKVVQAIAAQNDQRISEFRKNAAQAADRAISDLDARIEAQRQELVRETAGKSLSGHIGCGPVCRAMQANIASLEQARDQARQDKADRLQSLTAMSPARLEKDEGVKLLSDNADTRAQIRKQLQRDSGDTILGLPATEVIASSLFLLLFVMMAMLKLCQPRSVMIYFNEHLQEAYSHYLKGGFAGVSADVLRQADRHDGLSPMGAQRFDAWYHDSYLTSEAKLQSDAELRRLVEGREKVRQRKFQTDAQISGANELKSQIVSQLQEANTEASELEEKIMTNIANVKRTRLTQLAAKRAGLEAQQHDAEQIRAENDTKIELNEDQLGEVMASIRLAEDRLGIMVPFGEHTNKAANDPHLPALYATRNTLMTERNDMEIVRKHTDANLQQISRLIHDIDAAVTLCDEAGVDDRFMLEPEFTTLVEERQALKRDKDTAFTRANSLEERLAYQDTELAALKQQADADRQQIAVYDEEIRRRETAHDLTGDRRAA